MVNKHIEIFLSPNYIWYLKMVMLRGLQDNCEPTVNWHCIIPPSFYRAACNADAV